MTNKLVVHQGLIVIYNNIVDINIEDFINIPDGYVLLNAQEYLKGVKFILTKANAVKVNELMKTMNENNASNHYHAFTRHHEAAKLLNEIHSLSVFNPLVMVVNPNMCKVFGCIISLVNLAISILRIQDGQVSCGIEKSRTLGMVRIDNIEFNPIKPLCAYFERYTDNLLEGIIIKDGVYDFSNAYPNYLNHAPKQVVGNEGAFTVLLDNGKTKSVYYGVTSKYVREELIND